MQHTPFVKYIGKINTIRKNEFESSVVYKTPGEINPRYDVSMIIKTYYGEKIAEMLNLSVNYQITKEIFKKFQNYALKLNLEVKIQESNI